MLKKIGATADAVANGFEVLEALQRYPYTLLFLDCQMPEMDGYEVTRQLRKLEREANVLQPEKPPVYIIALTASAMQGDREQCLAAGMNDYLTKPVRVPDFQAALERWHAGAPV
jgi:CheY-like chemotaxis protein